MSIVGASTVGVSTVVQGLARWDGTYFIPLHVLQAFLLGSMCQNFLPLLN